MKKTEKRTHKPITMNKVRLVAVLLSLASCLFTFSYGFANWYQITIERTGTTQTGSFQTHGVLAVESAQPQLFEFVPAKGFLNENGEISDTGLISVPCVIDVTSCKNAFTATEWERESLKLTLTLGYKNLANDNFAEGQGLFTNLPITARIQKPNGTEVTTASALFSFDKSAEKLTTTYTFPCNELPNTAGATYLVIFEISLPVTTNPANFHKNLGQYLSVKEPITEFVALAELEKAH